MAMHASVKFSASSCTLFNVAMTSGTSAVSLALHRAAIDWSPAVGAAVSAVGSTDNSDGVAVTTIGWLLDPGHASDSAVDWAGDVVSSAGSGSVVLILRLVAVVVRPVPS